jgi:LPXTG-motif cell wall-anchored protein
MKQKKILTLILAALMFLFPEKTNAETNDIIINTDDEIFIEIEDEIIIETEDEIIIEPELPSIDNNEDDELIQEEEIIPEMPPVIEGGDETFIPNEPEITNPIIPPTNEEEDNIETEIPKEPDDTIIYEEEKPESNIPVIPSIPENDRNDEELPKKEETKEEIKEEIKEEVKTETENKINNEVNGKEPDVLEAVKVEENTTNDLKTITTNEPIKIKTVSAPNTGDSSNIILYSLGLITSFISITTFLKKKI